jgi:hypothetical protein
LSGKGCAGAMKEWQCIVKTTYDNQLISVGETITTSDDVDLPDHVFKLKGTAKSDENDDLNQTRINALDQLTANVIKDNAKALGIELDKTLTTKAGIIKFLIDSNKDEAVLNYNPDDDQKERYEALDKLEFEVIQDNAKALGIELAEDLSKEDAIKFLIEQGKDAEVLNYKSE